LSGHVDVTERKRAEQALRESETKFRDYAETASDWFWEIGPDHKFTLLTENAFGSDPAARIGTACWDHALDLETEPEKWRIVRATLEARRPFRDLVYRSARGDGTLMYVKASGKPVFDANGEFRGYRGTGADVTALMRAQEEHERLRQLESDLAHMNRLTMMGNWPPLWLTRSPNRSPPRATMPVRPSVSWTETRRIWTRSGKPSNVSWPMPIEREISSTGSVTTSRKRLRERIISI
jgi:PAS domain S-box-containing protein